MYQLIESIKVYNGHLANLPYHEKRMSLSLFELTASSVHPVDFKKLKIEADTLGKNQVYKLKIIYNDNSYNYKFIPYTLKAINSLKLIEDPTLIYRHKYEDRSKLSAHYSNRMPADDILISIHGAITDSYYCNVALEKNGQWLTPDLPLLDGTKRQFLIHKNIISPEEIYIEDVPDFDNICLFNAMIEFGEIVIPVSSILLD